jgi:hypothetical protein
MKTPVPEAVLIKTRKCDGYDPLLHDPTGVTHHYRRNRAMVGVANWQRMSACGRGERGTFDFIFWEKAVLGEWCNPRIFRIKRLAFLMQASIITWSQTHAYEPGLSGLMLGGKDRPC